MGLVMHGLINRALQCFVRDTYGADRWLEISQLAGLEFADFEAMLGYDDGLTEAVLDALVLRLGMPREAVLEDVGTYLVQHPNAESVRRLLRFGGVTFVDFLLSLDDLPDWARLAVSDLDLPKLEFCEHAANRFSVSCHSPHAGFGHVLMGILRALADDYGALVFLEHLGTQKHVEVIEITLIEAAYAKGRSFELGLAGG